MFKELRIGDCCQIGDGAHASIMRVESGIPYLTSKNFSTAGIKLDNVEFISQADYEKHFRSNSKALTKPSKGDLIFSIIGSLGGSYLYGKNDCFGLSSSVAIIRPCEDIIESSYMLYYLKSEYLQKWVDSIKSGAAQGFLSLAMIRSLPIVVPPLPTQKKIASILSAYDELIENNNQRIQLLEEMAEEIYKEWFVRMRFPGYEQSKWFDKEGIEVPQGTEGSLPKGWERKPLRNYLAHYIGGGWGEDDPVGKNTIPAHVIRGTDIPGYKKGNLNYEVLRYHTKSNLASRRCVPNDIIFEVSGGTETQSLGRTVFISKIALERFKDDVIAASFCKLMRTDESKTSPFYIYRLLNRMHSTGELAVFQVQSTGLSNYQFEDFIDGTKVLNPTRAVRDKFDEINAPMLDEIQMLGAKNQVLQETRDLLLPRLISGKLNVEGLAVEVQEVSMAAEPEATYGK